LHIITNGFKEAQHTKLKASSIGHFFEHVIISEEVGVHKPDPRIFHHAVKLSGAAHADECMMIGDTFQTDVFGALNAGFTAVHYSPYSNSEHEAPVITIRHLAELLDHLNKN
jgi:putative hydrolase of the HAD superfamily